MAATLVVIPHVVSGTERGGEDLYLIFRCTEESAEFEVSPEDGSVNWELEQDDETGETVGLYCQTEHYEHSWKGTPSDLLEIAFGLGLLDKSTWKWCGDSFEEPKLEWKHMFFVGGNAD